VTPLRKHSGKRVFPLADTLRFLMFPSLRFPRYRNTFLRVSDRFPFQESRISAIVNVCLCCRNAIFRTGNLLFRSFYWRKRDGFMQLHVSVEFTKYGNTLFRPVLGADAYSLRLIQVNSTLDKILKGRLLP